MTALLVLSEGSLDVGRPDGAHDGAVRVLARKVVEAALGRDLHDYEIAAAPIPRAHRITGPGKRMRLALTEMKSYRCDSVAFVIDADNVPERLDALRNEREVVQGEGGSPLPIAIGVAVQTVEAWLLADESAINDATLPKTPHGAVPSPETIWGAPRTPKHPKSVFQERLAAATLDVDAPYDAVASRTRLHVLENRCASFAAFASELRALVR